MLSFNRVPLSYIECQAFVDLTLTRLQLIECGLTQIPDLSGVCKTLESLSLNSNLIKVISTDDFYACNALESIDFQNNKISTIPDLWPIYSTLEVANFANNVISKVDHDMAEKQDGAFSNWKKSEMIAMRVLTLSDNCIEHLDLGRLFVWFPNLVTLDVSGNSIRSLDSFNVPQKCNVSSSYVLQMVSLNINPEF